MRRSFARERVVALALAAAVACRKRSPAVNFHSEAGAPPPRVVAADGSAPNDAGFAEVEGAAVEGDGASLTVEGATAQAPQGERFTAWVPVDLDGDGSARDVLAARRGLDGSARPPLVLRRGAAGFEAVAVGRADPPEAHCAESGVRATSPRSAVVWWRCPEAGAVAEEQALVALGATPEVRTRAALLPGELADTALALRLGGSDLDGDGRDEVVVAMRAGRGGVPGAPMRAEARATFFDRAGARARDTSEPTASLGAVVSAARQQLGRGRAGAVEALATLDDLARLRRAFCSDGGTARVRFEGLTGFDCRAAATPAVAELYARVLVNVGETPAAEAQLSPETASDFGAVTSERVVADIERAAMPERTVTARGGPFAAAALDALAPARLGVLAFDRAALALRGPSAGTVDLLTLTHTPGAAGAVAEVFPRSPDGATTVTGFAETCRGVAVVRCRTNDVACATVAVTAGATSLAPGAELSLLPALPSATFTMRCASDPRAVAGVSAAVARAVAWGAGGLLVSVRQRLYRVDAQGVATALVLGDALGPGWSPGGAVNPTGTVVAMPGRSGAWVRDRGAWRRWAPEGLAGRFAQMTDLTVSPDGRALAAVVGTQVWVLERPRTTRR